LYNQLEFTAKLRTESKRPMFLFSTIT